MDRLTEVDPGLASLIEAQPDDAARKQIALEATRSIVERVGLDAEPDVVAALEGAPDAAALEQVVERLDDLAWDRQDAGDDEGHLEAFSRARAASAVLEYAGDAPDGNLADVAYEIYGATGDVAYVRSLLTGVSRDLAERRANAWRYLLLTDVDDPDLARTVADGPAELLHRDGTWRPTDRLRAVRPGEAAAEWATPVDRGRAAGIIDGWLADGRLDARPAELAEFVPDDVAEGLARQRRHAALVEQLTTEQQLDPQTIARIRAELLDGPAELRERWRSRGRRVVEPVQTGWRLLSPGGAADVARALDDLDIESVWVIDTDPDDMSGMLGHPAGIESPVNADALFAVGSAYAGCGHVLLTDPTFQVALLHGADRDLVAGPAEFVGAVLGRADD